MESIRKQNEKEVQALQTVMKRQLQKSVGIEKMPSVRVRPTLRVELKHRIMNCKLPKQSKEESKNGFANIDSLNEQVLKAMQNRANIGGTFK